MLANTSHCLRASSYLSVRQARNVPSPCPSRHGPTPRQMAVSASGNTTVRVPKNPKDFASMDDLRDHLEAQGQTGFISGTLNWISETAFGSEGKKQPWWSPAGLYRTFTRGLRWNGGRGLDDDDGPEDPSDPLTQQITEKHQQLAPLLLISRNEMRKMAKRFPAVLTMSAAEVATRLLHMREALPGCNTCLLVEQNPHLFLTGDPAEKRAQVASAAKKLCEGLKGAAVADVIMWDPEILFMDLDYGLQELRDLWDVDEQAMAASEPKHLAFAVRAMCNTKRGETVPEVVPLVQ